MAVSDDIVKELHDKVNEVSETLNTKIRQINEKEKNIKELSAKVANIANLKTQDNENIELVIKALLKKYILLMTSNQFDRQFK